MGFRRRVLGLDSLVALDRTHTADRRGLLFALSGELLRLGDAFGGHAGYVCSEFLRLAFL